MLEQTAMFAVIPFPFREDAAVNFHHIPGNRLDQVQGRVAHAIIVYGSTKAFLLQPADDSPQVAEFHVCGGFRKFKLNKLMGNPVPVNDRNQIGQQVPVHHMLAGQVHRDAYHRQPRVKPAPDIPAHMVQHIKIQPANIAGLFQRRDKITGGNGPAVMTPAAQGFRAADLPGTDIHLGLVHRIILFLPQGMDKVLLDVGDLFPFPGQFIIIEHDMILFSAHSRHISGKERTPDVIRTMEHKPVRNHEHAGIGGNGYNVIRLFVIGDPGFKQAGQQLLQQLLPAYRYKIIARQTAYDTFCADPFFYGFVMTAQHGIGLFPAQFLIHHRKMPQIIPHNREAHKPARSFDLHEMVLQAPGVPVPIVIEKCQIFNRTLHPVAADKIQRKTHNKFHTPPFLRRKRPDAGLHVHSHGSDRHTAGHHTLERHGLPFSDVETAEGLPAAFLFFIQAAVQAGHAPAETEQSGNFSQNLLNL